MSIRMPSCQALRVGVRSGVSDPFRVDFAGIQEHAKEEAFASCGVYWSMLGHNHRNRDPADFAISKNRGIGRLRYQTIEVRDSAWDTLLGILCLGYSAWDILLQGLRFRPASPTSTASVTIGTVGKAPKLSCRRRDSWNARLRCAGLRCAGLRCGGGSRFCSVKVVVS